MIAWFYDVEYDEVVLSFGDDFRCEIKEARDE